MLYGCVLLFSALHSLITNLGLESNGIISERLFCLLHLRESIPYPTPGTLSTASCLNPCHSELFIFNLFIVHLPSKDCKQTVGIFMSVAPMNRSMLCIQQVNNEHLQMHAAVNELKDCLFTF